MTLLGDFKLEVPYSLFCVPSPIQDRGPHGVGKLSQGNRMQVVSASITILIFPRFEQARHEAVLFYKCLYKQMAGKHSVVTGREDKA